MFKIFVADSVHYSKLPCLSLFIKVGCLEEITLSDKAAVAYLDLPYSSNGEFVDMTLAADGYLVKVHQVIIALSSPFLKDLIIAAQCPHPVIILNKISHNTLAAILEYIYTGEVLVAVEDLNELIDAAKELHIKGLQEMNLSQALTSERQNSPILFSTQLAPSGLEGEGDICYFEISHLPENTNVPTDIEKESLNISIKEMSQEECKEFNEVTSDTLPSNIVNRVPTLEEHTSLGLVQYTVSNQGSLQLILNRYIYYLKHTNRDNTRQWRCVDYLNHYKCPAYVVTLDNVVVQRTSAHSHAFHDKKILKKLESGAIFTTIKDAENEGTIKKNNRQNEEYESE